MTSFALGRWSFRVGFLASAFVLGCGDGSETRPSASQGGSGGASASPITDTVSKGGRATETASGGNSTSSGTTPYHACSSAVATGQAPLISTFDDGNLSVLPNEGRAGLWFTYNDGSKGQFTKEVEEGALHVTSSGWTGWGAGFGVSIGPWLANGERCYYNAEKYAGIRFRAKGKGRFRAMVATRENLPVADGGASECAPNDCYNYPGGYARLTGDWQVFEYPFCTMRPQPLWGGAVAPIQPSELIGIQFALARDGQDYDLWLDDLEFFTAETAQGSVDCSKPCPLELVPYPETIVPESAQVPLESGLTLHTFDQATVRCGLMRRRYLSYVPTDSSQRSNAPVVIVLHGSAANAESMEDFQTKGRFNELAIRDGFIVVYGNAAPGELSSDNRWFPNTGAWRQDLFDDGEIDDVEYLSLVLDDLKTRSVISGNNDVYLVGMSNGGGMVLKAATEHPELWTGIAPFMAFDGWEPPPVPNLSGTRLKRVLFGISPNDPGLFNGTYTSVLAALPAKWATAMGLPTDAIQNPVRSELSNLVNEGESYTGSNAIALRTRNSSVTQIDMSTTEMPGKLRVLEFARGGHFWPNPVGDTDPLMNETYGFRNQDLDSADATWEFFKSSN
jgi:polyhydroxybutyrate depolymerase